MADDYYYNISDDLPPFLRNGTVQSPEFEDIYAKLYSEALPLDEVSALLRHRKGHGMNEQQTNFLRALFIEAKVKLSRIQHGITENDTNQLRECTQHYQPRHAANVREEVYLRAFQNEDLCNDLDRVMINTANEQQLAAFRDHVRWCSFSRVSKAERKQEEEALRARESARANKANKRRLEQEKFRDEQRKHEQETSRARQSAQAKEANWKWSEQEKRQDEQRKRRQQRTQQKRRQEPRTTPNSTLDRVTPKPIAAWREHVRSAFQDYAAIKVFPSPPGICCNRDGCRSQKNAQGRLNPACDCNIRAAFQMARVADLKQERKKWHPDRFAKCEESERMQKMAQEVFVVVDAMWREGQ